MLARMWSQENNPPLLIGVQTYTATMENKMVVSQKIVNQSKLKMQFTTLGHIPIKAPSNHKDTCSTMLIVALFIIVKNWKLKNA